MEQCLHRICRLKTTFLDTAEWKRLVIDQSTRVTNVFFNGKDKKSGDRIDWYQPDQQDVAEFLSGFLETLLEGRDRYDILGELVERAPLSTEIRQALDDAIGFKIGATRRCLGCNHKHREPQREMKILQLTVDPRDRRNQNASYKMHVNGCLKAASEEVDNLGEKMMCSNCNQNCVYNTQTTLSDPKSCVIIQLMRFQSTGSTTGQAVLKINDEVEVDEILDQGPLNGYVLTGGILHRGHSVNSGHYRHILRDVETGQFWLTDDAAEPKRLEAQKAKKLLSLEGYVLFYSPPTDIPPPLKETLMPAAKDPENKSKPATARKLFPSGKFKTLDGAPEAPVRIPTIPSTSAVFQLPTDTPTREQLSAKLQAKGTRQQQPIIAARAELADALKENFGYDNFRSWEQMEATEEVIRGTQDLLVVMSTGSGKSLIYQLGAIMMGKLAIVISPTIALAQDQVTELENRNLQARLLTANVSIHFIYGFLKMMISPSEQSCYQVGRGQGRPHIPLSQDQIFVRYAGKYSNCTFLLKTNISFRSAWSA